MEDFLKTHPHTKLSKATISTAKTPTCSNGASNSAQPSHTKPHACGKHTPAKGSELLGEEEEEEGGDSPEPPTRVNRQGLGTAMRAVHDAVLHACAGGYLAGLPAVVLRALLAQLAGVMVAGRGTLLMEGVPVSDLACSTTSMSGQASMSGM